MLKSSTNAGKKALFIGKDVSIKALFVASILLMFLMLLTASGIMVNGELQNKQIQNNIKTVEVLLPKSIDINPIISNLESSSLFLTVEPLERSEMQPETSAENKIIKATYVKNLSVGQVKHALGHDYTDIAETTFKKSTTSVSPIYITIRNILLLVFSIIVFINIIIAKFAILCGTRETSPTIKTLKYMGATDYFLTSIIIKQIINTIFVAFIISILMFFSFASYIYFLSHSSKPFIDILKQTSMDNIILDLSILLLAPTFGLIITWVASFFITKNSIKNIK